MKTNPGIWAKLAPSILATAMLLLGSRLAIAARFDPAQWYVREFNPRLLPPSGFRPAATNTTGVIVEATNSSVSLTALYDNDPSTGITLSNRTTLLVDLGQTSIVHRVYLSGGTQKLAVWPDTYSKRDLPPLGVLLVYVGDTARTTNEVAAFTVPYNAGNPVDCEIDLRFGPATGRYVRIQLQTQVTWGFEYWPGFAFASQPPATNVDWKVAEVEIYGFSGQATWDDAVVLPTGAAPPLALAAAELSYYLGELTGKPHTIIPPSQTSNYLGRLYTIVDSKPLAPDYATMTNNMARGVLPTNEVNVTASGRVISFNGWPYRSVLWSVWEFLERQGVRWVYPSSHGDLVPSGAGVNLGILPLRMNSAARIIYANWDAASFLPWPSYQKQTFRQEYLYVWRNRWTGSSSPLEAGEIPPMPTTGVSLDQQYSEGFAGYPHNMGAVMPSRILATNAAWWGSADGTNYSDVGVQFEMASTPAEIWVANKVRSYDAARPIASVAPLNLHPGWQSYQLLPVDAVVFSVGTNMQAATNLYGGPRTYLPWKATTGNTFSGGAYYKLLATVASNAPNQIIGGLAYADIFDPPRSNYPSNVRMEVTLWGSPNLPLSSPVNSRMWNALLDWKRACSQLAYYDYALLFVDYWQRNSLVPVPMVSALVTNANMLGSIGALDGGCQAFVGAELDVAFSTIKYNPWNFYAYPRTRWNTNYTANNLVTEFFTGYYKESAAPMLNYYRGMESWQLTNNVDLHNLIGYCYWIGPGAFPRSLLHQMDTNLLVAQALATNWYVIDRIKDARETWWYCCTNQGIADVSTLTNFSSFPAVTTTGTHSVIVTNLTQYWPTRSIYGYYFAPAYKTDNGGRLDFNGAAIASQTLNFAQAGTYRVDIVSFCSYPPNGWPSQKVYLGGATSGSITITNTTPVTNSFLANIPTATALDLVVAQEENGRFLQVSKIYLTRQ